MKRFSVTLARGAYRALQLDDDALLRELGLSLRSVPRGWVVSGDVARLPELYKYVRACANRDAGSTGDKRSAEAALARVATEHRLCIGEPEPLPMVRP